MNRTKLLAAALVTLALAPGSAWAAGPNKPPVVKLTAPTAGQVFMLPPSITLAATATDSHGVTKVDFYRGTTLIGTDTTSPYSVDWLNPTLGTHSLTARATDTLGAVGTSAAVSITVQAPTSALIQSPADGAQLYGSTVTITGTFNGGRETSIIADNGITSRMRAPAQNDFSNTFSLSLPLVRGPNTITVTAARYDQTYEAHSITVIGNDAPFVAFKSPAAGAHDSPVSLLLEAEALSPSGSIGLVEFLIDGALRGTDTSAPYQYTWSNPPLGSHTLTVRAYDQNNFTATDTRSVTINTPNALPNVALTAPADGAVFQNGATITLQATASDPDGTISRVEFLRNGVVVGTDTSSPYSFNWTNAQTGSYAVAARAIDNRSGTTTSAVANITVNPPNGPPSVTLDSPPNGAEFTSPASIQLAASAADSDGSVMWVEFYSGSTLLASDSTPPYTYEWNAVFSGSYALRARAVDNMGAVTDSAIATVTVNDPPNELPTVSLTSPSDGATFGDPADIPLAANAADSDGTIVRVEFYAGSTLIGAVTTPPYAMTWSDVAQGSYAVTARAVDNRGGERFSAAANVTVVPNELPIVSLDSPSDGATFGASDDIPLAATAADTDGTIARVEFYAGPTLIGTVTSAPYAMTWLDVPAGDYAVTARAIDDRSGAAVSAAASITVTPNASPTVSVSTPAAEVYGPTTITLTATASDSDGTVTKVDFFANGALLGTDDTAPYSFDWVNGAAGTYSITATATDNDDGVGTSAPASFTVKALGLSITTPSDGVLLVGDHVIVSGTFDAPFNSGVTVNGQAAAIIGNQFHANVVIGAGSNSITTRLTTPLGLTLERGVTVTSDGASPFLDITANSLEGITPLEVTFTVKNDTTVDADVVFDGSATFTVPAGTSIPVTVTYGTPGARTESFTASNGLGQSMSEEFKIVALDPVIMDQRFGAIWGGMNDALLAGDKAKALGFLSGQARQKYEPVFDALMGEYPSIVATFSPLSRGELSTEMAEYIVVRELGDTDEIFLVYFTRGPDGVWRLVSM